MGLSCTGYHVSWIILVFAVMCMHIIMSSKIIQDLLLKINKYLIQR